MEYDSDMDSKRPSEQMTVNTDSPQGTNAEVSSFFVDFISNCNESLEENIFGNVKFDIDFRLKSYMYTRPSHLCRL